MLNEFSQTSRSSTIVDNSFQDFQSSTMTSKRSPKSESVSIPVPRLIDYRFVHITPISENPPNFEWLAFQRVSNYIVQLSDSKGIVWRDTIHSTKEQTVTYYSETLLKPGKDYIFTVEIDRQYSCVDSCDKKEINIAKKVKKGIEEIKDTGLPRQFATSIITQLDGLLIARKELLHIIRGAVKQGSNSEIICFIDDFLSQGSAFELLADACSSDDILDALAEIASQLAAASITLGKYLNLSGVQKALAETLVSKGSDFAFFAQNLEGSLKFEQLSFSTVCEECKQAINDCLQNNSKKYCKRKYCRAGMPCASCLACQELDPS